MIEYFSLTKVLREVFSDFPIILIPLTFFIETQTVTTVTFHCEIYGPYMNRSTSLTTGSSGSGSSDHLIISLTFFLQYQEICTLFKCQN